MVQSQKPGTPDRRNCARRNIPTAFPLCLVAFSCGLTRTVAHQVYSCAPWFSPLLYNIEQHQQAPYCSTFLPSRSPSRLTHAVRPPLFGSQDGPFCVFPTDFSIGEGETAFVNVEYLPSEVGLHEARFVMLQVRHKLNRL